MPDGLGGADAATVAGLRRYGLISLSQDGELLRMHPTIQDAVRAADPRHRGRRHPPAGPPGRVEDRSWSYLATVATARAGGTGRLLAEVHTAGNGLPTGPCALARAFWSMGGDCQEVDSGGREVGVVVQPGADQRIDQWAAYRHPDGIVVYVAQSRFATNGDTGLRPLTALPLSVPELAALAVNPRFHLE